MTRSASRHQGLAPAFLPLLLLLALLCPPALAGQDMDEDAARQRAPEFSRADEIALARSAAPASISDQATVLVLDAGTYVTAVEGSNGVTCMVSRSLPFSVEPICYDPEASRTIREIETRRVESRLAGLSVEEVDARVATLIGTGELRLPARPAFAYMMSSGQVLYADADTRVGAFMPHIHIYWPYATAEQFGALGQAPSEGVTITDPGLPTASLIIFGPDFVEPTVGGGR